MRRVRYSVAMSLDGYVAGPNGESDWIEMDPSVDQAAFFQELYSQFDTAVMGRKSFDVYGGAVEGMKTYVFSRTLSVAPKPDVEVVGEEGIELLHKLRKSKGKDIWLFGGGNLFGSLADAGLVDSVEVGVIPVILGAGLPLMSLEHRRVKLKLTECEKMTNTVMLKYAVKR